MRVEKALLLAGIWAVTIAAGEWLTRVFLPTRVPADHRDERALLHRWHRDLGWFPIPGSTYVFEGGTVPIHVRHNAAGFRDRVEIFNLGVSGYGTDQELLLLKREFEGIAPDAVFLLHCRENDRSPQRPVHRPFRGPPLRGKRNALDSERSSGRRRAHCPVPREPGCPSDLRLIAK